MPRKDNANHHLYTVGSTWYFKIEIRAQAIRRTLATTDVVEARRRRDLMIEELSGELHSWQQTVRRWLVGWLPDNVKPATAARYRSSVAQMAGALVRANKTLREHEKRRLDSLPIERMTLTTISDLVSWLKTDRPSLKDASTKHMQKVTNATVRRDLTALSMLLRATVAWGWREDNPVRQWDRGIIKERRRPVYLPPDEHVRAVVDASPSMWGKAIALLDATGMREMEVFRLRHDQIERDLSGATIIGKGDRIRFVPFDSTAVSILAELPRHLNSQWVFWHGNGQPYRNVASRHRQICSTAKVKELLKDVQHTTDNVPTFSLHHLRHRFAVRYLKDGGSIYRLKAILGHQSVKTTEIYLSFLDPKMKLCATELIGS